MSHNRVSLKASVFVTSWKTTLLYITPPVAALKTPASRRGSSPFASSKSNSAVSLALMRLMDPPSIG